MSTAALVLAACFVIACVVFVAQPFLRERAERGDIASVNGSRVRWSEERDRALAALKELEFDHRTGKLSDEDYRELVGPLRREAAEALRALDVEENGTA